MSARNFYQTLYQSDSIFRIANESWSVNETVDQVVDEVGALVSDDLLSALETLAAESTVVNNELLLVDEPVMAPGVPTSTPEPIVIVTAPEALPEPAPRPTTPSIFPPAQQQPRLPQLNHKVLLLADEELDPSNLLFLEKILKAVNLNIDGVDLLNLHGVQDMNFAELLRGKYINHFITFGVPFERVNLDIMMDRYAPVRFEGITFLMADSLPTIEADQNLKKRLWAALRRVFL
ncbi:hypothetical protein [Spirosoma jeollabukense]